jgi:hypothetical protein
MVPSVILLAVGWCLRFKKVANLTEQARQAGVALLLDANRLGTPFEIVGLNKKKRFTGETPASLEQVNPGSYTVYLRPERFPEYERMVQINSGEAINVSQVFNVTSPQEIRSPPKKDAAWL